MLKYYFKIVFGQSEVVFLNCTALCLGNRKRLLNFIFLEGGGVIFHVFVIYLAIFHNAEKLQKYFKKFYHSKENILLHIFLKVTRKLD